MFLLAHQILKLKWNEDDMRQVQEFGDTKLGIRFGRNVILMIPILNVSVVYTHVIC